MITGEEDRVQTPVPIKLPSSQFVLIGKPEKTLKLKQEEEKEEKICRRRTFWWWERESSKKDHHSNLLPLSSAFSMRFNSKKGSQEDLSTEKKMTCFTEISSLMITISIVIIFAYPFLQSSPPTEATKSSNSNHDPLFNYRQSPNFKNSVKCAIFPTSSTSSKICNPSLVHISMTLDTKFLRGSVAAIHSILRHSHCPENLFFHFISSDSTNPEPHLEKIFPLLAFKIYYFNPGIVQNKISSTIREALEHPLNYARNYLAELLEPCVERVIYLDSDIILVDDISNLWRTSLGSRTVGSPEYCHANFTNYFTPKFWSHKKFFRAFRGRRPCYFNTGVMVIDLSKWRKYRYTRKLERWMKIQRVHRIYELGSLPPFLLVFGGKIAPIHQRWNQHGLGGDNLRGSCRNIHAGPVSLLHWSGGGKPWLRLDSANSCPLDEIWARYDLHAPPM